MAGMFDFNANVDPADPSSREAMLMRQKVALALMARDRKGYPKTFGEGLTAVGDALAEVGQTRSAERSLAAYEKYQKEHPGPTAADLLPKTSDAGDATARPAVASDETTPAPVETAETPPPQVSPMVQQAALTPSTLPPGRFPNAPVSPMNDAQASQMAMLRGAPRPPSPYAPVAALEGGDTQTDAPTNPLLRDSLTRTLMTAQGVPQPNPTQTAAAPPTSLPPSTPASLGSPPDAAGNRPIVIPDLKQPQVVTPGAQVAQAGPSPSIPQTNRITPPVTMPPSDMPTLPKNEPLTKAEIEGYRLLDLGQRLQDPVKTQQGETFIKAGAAWRTKQDNDNMEQYKLQMQTYHARTLAQEAAEREAVLKQQGVIRQGASPAVPGAAVDQRLLGTPQSPQRSGIITPQPVPYNTTPQEWATKQSEDAAKAAAAYEKALPAFNESLKVIRLAREHPGRKFGVGITSDFARRFGGTEAADFGAVMDQLVGKNFLAGYDALRGAGQIANIEGTKSEQARGRVATAQTPHGFDTGLNDLETSLRTDLETIQRKMNVPVTAWQHSPNDPVAPDKGQVDERPGKVGLYEYLGGNPALDSSYRRVR